MPIDVLMPQLSPTMSEGRLASWLKKEGDTISAGDVIAEVETDKATMEVEATDDGILHKIIEQPGTDILVGAPIAVIAGEGEKVPADYAPVSQAKSADAAPAAVDSAAQAQPAAKSAPQAAAAPSGFVAPPPPPVITGGLAPYQQATGGRVVASPLAKKMAKNAGLNLNGVVGTGPRGRIVKADIHRIQMNAQHAVRQADKTEKLTPMRKAIATRLTAAKQHVPHFYLTAEVRMDALLDIRAQLNETAPLDDETEQPLYKISVNDMIIKASANALRKYPAANAAWNTDSVVLFGNVDVAVAVAIDGGLITPIVKNADQKSLPQISREMKELAAKARKGKLQPEEYEGGSFSLSNLGMYGVKEFKAIINPPQAAILACGATEEKPVVRNGQLGVAQVMTLTLSVDHRVIDGALGAELLGAVKTSLEKPVTLLV